MHDNTYRLMQEFQAKHVPDMAGLTLLEVGSRYVNGSYRPIWDGVATYTGIDISDGPGIDLVVPPFAYPFPDASFDIVISGQAMEHSARPWAMVNEMGRLLKPGGHICLIAPWQWEVHDYPVDCFRILADGMRTMMTDAGLMVLECFHSEYDCIGIGTNP